MAEVGEAGKVRIPRVKWSLQWPQIQPAIVVNGTNRNIHLWCYSMHFEIRHSLFDIQSNIPFLAGSINGAFKKGHHLVVLISDGNMINRNFIG